MKLLSFITSTFLFLVTFVAFSQEVNNDRGRLFDKKNDYLSKTLKAMSVNSDSALIYAKIYTEVVNDLGIPLELLLNQYGWSTYLPTSYGFQMYLNQAAKQNVTALSEKEYHKTVVKSTKQLTNSFKLFVESDDMLLAKNFYSLSHFFDFYSDKYSPNALNKKMKEYIAYLELNDFGVYDYFPYYVLGIIYEYSSTTDKGLINKLLTQGIKSTELFLASSSLDSENRVLYEFFLGHLYALQADQCLDKGDIDSCRSYLAKATRKININSKALESSIYYSVMTSYLHYFRKDDFEAVHKKRLSFLDKYTADKEEYMEVLTDLNLINPVWKDSADRFYTANYGGNLENRGIEYAISANKKMVISTEKLDSLFGKEVFNDGQFILLDFWGTWCGACLSESHLIEQLYQKTISHPKLKLITIACEDNEKRVADFMLKKDYHFPVHISDGTYEKLFAIKAFPTKLIVSPKGEVMVIPGLGEDSYHLISSYFSIND